MLCEQFAQVAGIVGQNVGSRHDCLRRDECIYGIRPARSSKQHAGQSADLLIDREDSDSVSLAAEVDRAHARTDAG